MLSNNGLLDPRHNIVRIPTIGMYVLTCIHMHIHLGGTTRDILDDFNEPVPLSCCHCVNSSSDNGLQTDRQERVFFFTNLPTHFNLTKPS